MAFDPSLLLPGCNAPCTFCGGCSCVGGPIPLAQLDITSVVDDMFGLTCGGDTMVGFLQTAFQHQYQSECEGAARDCVDTLFSGTSFTSWGFGQNFETLDTSTTAFEVAVSIKASYGYTDGPTYSPFTNTFSYARFEWSFLRTVVFRYGTTERTCPDLTTGTIVSDTLSVTVEYAQARPGVITSDTGVITTTQDGLTLTERDKETPFAGASNHFFSRSLTLNGPTADAVTNDPGLTDTSDPDYYWYGVNFKNCGIDISWL